MLPLLPNSFSSVLPRIELSIKLFLKNHYDTSSLIHYWKESLLTIYNPTLHIKYTLQLPSTIISDAESISYDSYIYITGGDYTNNVIQIYPAKKTIAIKRQMLTSKYRHALCRTSNCIYSLGGYDRFQPIYDAQIYSPTKDYWTQLPNLLTARSYCTAFSFNNKFVFCMFGEKISKECCLEKIDIATHTKWEHVNIKNPISERSKVHGIQLNESQVLIFGGYNKNKTSDCFALNIKDTVETFKCEDMVYPACFYNCSAPFRNRRKVYAVDYYRRIHMFTLNKWSVLR